MFPDHAVVRLSRPDSDFTFEPTIYDPSYGEKSPGVDRVAAEQAWQDASLDYWNWGFLNMTEMLIETEASTPKVMHETGRDEIDFGLSS